MKNSDFPTTHQETADLLKAMDETWVPEEHPDFNALNADGLKNEIKMALCSHQTHAKRQHKMPDGRILEIPNFCRLCPKCHEMEARKHKSNFDKTARKALELKPNGEWRMKLVQKGTESASLKKRIKRNQDGMHMAIDSTEHFDKEEIWSFVDSNDNGAYGNKVNPDSINWDTINRSNKETGNKVSRGSGLRLSPKPDVQENTEKLMIPGIVIQDKSQENSIREIMQDTNLLELATDTKNAQHLIILQFQYILQELEKEGYTNLTVKNGYYNMTEEKLLKDWNDNVNRCMSLYSTIDNNLSADMDTIDMVKRFYTTQKEEELV